FRSFDLGADDMRRLVTAFAARRPDRTEPLLVVGLRTAGAYPASLVAAYLDREGWERVEVLTLRPEQDLLAHERRALATGAEVVIVDEPPRAGAQFVLAATQLEQAGVPRHSLVLFVPVFAEAP